jgi:hypothetical protein
MQAIARDCGRRHSSQFITGGQAQCRISSKYLVLQIMAAKRGLVTRLTA